MSLLNIPLEIVWMSLSLNQRKGFVCTKWPRNSHKVNEYNNLETLVSDIDCCDLAVTANIKTLVQAFYC